MTLMNIPHPRFRLRPNFIVWALALCLLLFPPQVQISQAQTSVYSGSMTTGSAGNNIGFCADESTTSTDCIVFPGVVSSTGSLSPDSCTLSGSSYDIHAIIYLTTTDRFYLSFSAALPSASLARMTLTIGTSSWSLADATTQTLASSPSYYWSESSTPISHATTYAVSLTLAAEESSLIDDSVSSGSGGGSGGGASDAIDSSDSGSGSGNGAVEAAAAETAEAAAVEAAAVEAAAVEAAAVEAAAVEAAAAAFAQRPRAPVTNYRTQ